ncbi:endo alpha-1,4 polygalactosaminidase [Nocardioides sp. ChNu-153]|uniref:endo alpha-1,4 polygalactosaminidase n=1 Tax=Nocardioides sp. ChNu-153 TaxID=2779364 RepID=UPI0026518EE5|nr:endo alpha-1,4 polygalactosaminidase [Nocardioides sp. ChNu-153]MDN7120655.1 endo alpha-1,4 polygalactosaminidase [Nocardioides sp. ChNu-153]
MGTRGTGRVRRGSAVAGTVTALALAVVGCANQAGDEGSGAGSDQGPDGGTESSAAGDATVTLPPAGARWDYQIGGPRDVPDDVAVVERDREAEPLEGVYNLCYVNAFQAQPGDEATWGDLLLVDAAGEPVVDEDWDEALLDTSTPERREALVEVVRPWIEGCADDGFDAVELDNLDSFLRSDGLLTLDDAAAYAELLVDVGHEVGLAVAQKNLGEYDGTAVGFDLAVVEECGAYDECGAYTASYGDRVLVVEYTDEGLATACAGWGEELSVVRRDLDLAPDGERAWCD